MDLNTLIDDDDIMREYSIVRTETTSKYTFRDESKRTIAVSRGGSMKAKKVEFDEQVEIDKTLTLKKGIQSICHLYDLKRPFSTTVVEKDYYFCDWFPELFGIDEDEMPESEYGEGLFDFDWESLEESISEGSSDEEKVPHYYYKHPKYGRRAKQKPTLEKENHEKFECLCLIDRKYSRHHVPHFGERKPGEELRVPHFRMFWEDLKEQAETKEEHQKAAIVLLRSGKYFSDLEENWWWLAEEFYTKALKVSEKNVLDGGKIEAIANYILGTFLLDYVQKMQPAQERLLRARELSMGKDWSAKKILRNNQDTVYKECANYLCRALIAVSKELREQGKPEEALPHICRSHKLCQETQTSRWDIEMETYFELGLTYQEVGYYEWARVAFRKYLELAVAHGLSKNICDAFLEMAICYKREEDFDRCFRHILSFLKYAQNNNCDNLVPFGYRYLGELYLDRGNSKLAAQNFEKAFFGFHDLFVECASIPFKDWQQEHYNLGNDVELTRVLTGLAYGESVTKPICNLIVNAKEKTDKGMKKLFNWKSDPGKFLEADNWEEEEEDDEGSKASSDYSETMAGKAGSSAAGGLGIPGTSEADINDESRIVRFAV